MKVVQINGSFGDEDSTGRSTKEMHQWFIDHDIESYVFVTQINDGSPTDSYINLYSTKRSQKIHGFLSRMTGLQGYYSANDTIKLCRKIEEINPDVVILGILHNNSINLPILFDVLRERGIFTILVLHDCWFFTGHCCYYSEVNCQKWRGICNKCPQIHAWNTSWFFDRAGKCQRDKKSFYEKNRIAVVGVSSWITNEARKSILKDIKKIVTIYNWIDLDVFKPKDKKALRIKYGLMEKAHILIGVASEWNDRKGIKEIVRVARELPEIKILLIGKVDNNMLPPNVISFGVIRDVHLLSDYYAMSDLFLNPSKQETFGKTTAEAICCGTPVVAYQTTACTELIEGSRCGRIVKYGDVTGFVKTVSELLSSNLDEFVRYGNEFARMNFDKEINIRKYVELIEDSKRDYERIY